MGSGPRCYYCGRFLPYLPRPEGDEDGVVTVKVQDYLGYEPPEYGAAHKRCARLDREDGA